MHFVCSQWLLCLLLPCIYIYLPKIFYNHHISSFKIHEPTLTLAGWPQWRYSIAKPPPSGRPRRANARKSTSPSRMWSHALVLPQSWRDVKRWKHLYHSCQGEIMYIVAKTEYSWIKSEITVLANSWKTLLRYSDAVEACRSITLLALFLIPIPHASNRQRISRPWCIWRFDEILFAHRRGRPHCSRSKRPLWSSPNTKEVGQHDSTRVKLLVLSTF